MKLNKIKESYSIFSCRYWKKTNHVKYLDYSNQVSETADWSKSRTIEITKAQSLDTYILSETH